VRKQGVMKACRERGYVSWGILVEAYNTEIIMHANHICFTKVYGIKNQLTTRVQFTPPNTSCDHVLSLEVLPNRSVASWHNLRRTLFFPTPNHVYTPTTRYPNHPRRPKSKELTRRSERSVQINPESKERHGTIGPTIRIIEIQGGRV